MFVQGYSSGLMFSGGFQLLSGVEKFQLDVCQAWGACLDILIRGLTSDLPYIQASSDRLYSKITKKSFNIVELGSISALLRVLLSNILSRPVAKDNDNDCGPT